MKIKKNEKILPLHIYHKLKLFGGSSCSVALSLLLILNTDFGQKVSQQNQIIFIALLILLALLGLIAISCYILIFCYRFQNLIEKENEKSLRILMFAHHKMSNVFGMITGICIIASSAFSSLTIEFQAEDIGLIALVLFGFYTCIESILYLWEEKKDNQS